MNRTRSLILNIALVIASFLFSLAIIEVGLRLRKGELTHFQNILFKSHNFQPDRLSVGYPEQFDSLLGWVPKSNIEALDRTTGSPVKTLNHGIRSTGHFQTKSKKMILTVGDSFTWGDQVANEETWPTYLQQILQTPVINAGVSGYGIDQAILRAESLIDSIKPTHLILSFIANDIIRCGWSKSWGMAKPFFKVSEKGLQLANSPVSQIPPKRPELGPMRNLLGRSYLAHAIMIRLAPNYWLAGLGYTFEMGEPRYEEVACRLMDRLKLLGQKTRTKILVVAQYEENLTKEDIKLTKNLIDCANKQGIKTLDLLPLMEEMRNKGKAEYSAFINWHHTAAGNKRVAERIATYIEN